MLHFSILHSTHPPPPLTTQLKNSEFQSKSTTRFSSLRLPPIQFRLFRRKKFLGYSNSWSSSCSPLISASSSHSAYASASTSVDYDFEEELGRLLALLPEEMRRRVSEHDELRELIEVVMDLGRSPLARFPSGDFVLSEKPITVQDLELATSQAGDFAVDNRAGISRTLHRISAIRNRKGMIIGLTCRVGRAVRGSANLVRDLVQDGASLLLIGPPGVGKTTIIREIARMLANDYKKRVMIVDTSNEIGGDGDIPHAGIGNARRMQVPVSDMQHKVLIEAVENHMPQVIVIDEIGTKLEAMAATTIAQRGIQLVATAHGVTIENLIMNPSLEILVGGVQSVTLGDEEANRRGVQKTVLERRGPSTFSSGVEIVSKTELRIHRSLEATVDAILSGRLPNVQIRKINSQGVEETADFDLPSDTTLNSKDESLVGDISRLNTENTGNSEFPSEHLPSTEEDSSGYDMPFYLYIYGIAEPSVIQGIKQLDIDGEIELTDNISEADALLALQSKLKKNPGIQAAAKSHDIPIYVTKTSSVVQVTKSIRALIADHTDGLKDFSSDDQIKFSEKMDALEEARAAIEQVVIPEGEPMELLPRPSRILSLQVKLVRQYQLQSETICKGSELCLRILPLHTGMDYDSDEEADEEFELDEFVCSSGDSNGSYSIDRLPLLPD